MPFEKKVAMYYYIEQWKHRPEWIALTPADRGKFLFDLSPTLQGLVDGGAELVGYLINDTDTHHRADFRFLRIWRIPEKEFAQRIEEALEKAGWHEFFEHGNARGEVLTPQMAIPYLVNP